MSVVTASLLPDPPRRRDDEFELQKAVCQFLRWALPESAVFFSVPNGGLRHTKVAARLAATGLKAGIPDLQVVFKSRAIFIELKAKAGRLSEVQRQMHKRLIYAGADVLLCKSVADVERALRDAGMPLRASVMA